MPEAPWIFPALAGRRWARANLDALARVEFPSTVEPNPLNDAGFCHHWVGEVATRLGAEHCWGGWLVLRSGEPEGGADYVLPGHLAHAGLPPAGTHVTRGTAVGVIGKPEQNGGWYPHLHRQALSAEAWEAVQHAPDALLDGYGYADASLSRRLPNPAPLAGLR